MERKHSAAERINWPEPNVPTKERILQTALQLFAQSGYEAVSVQDIASRLSMTKGALYRHYKSKRDIFTSIVSRMEAMDSARAKEYAMPDAPAEKQADRYRQATLERILIYSEAQFRYWTEDPFSSCFRKLLTLEQYRDSEMAALYDQYLSGGPVGYMADLFAAMLGNATEGMRLAVAFYAPIFLLYSLYDGARDKSEPLAILKTHFVGFTIQFERNQARMKPIDYTIRLETPADYHEVEHLTREAFWNVYRPGCLEHYVLHCYRDRPDFVPALDFVMEKDGKLIGHVMYVRAKITADDGRELPIMTFGPISILPEYKRQGYGKALLDYSMEQARALGAGALCIEGNIDFYGKSGFVVASTKGIHYYAEPKEEVVPYFLLKELTDGYLAGITGTYHTPEGYFVDEKEGEAFDAQFPPKLKLKLPGQLV